jgi:hypothetical protein
VSYKVAAFKKITHTEPPVPKKRGRPKGKPSLAVALTHELINKKAETVVKKVLEIALNDGHPKQTEMLKLCFDRLAPMSVFEKAAEHQKNSGIEININVVAPKPEAAVAEVIEVVAVERAERADVEGA